MFKLFSLSGGISAADGFFADGVAAGLKNGSKYDIAFIYSETLCDVFSCFTNNKFDAAPIKYTKRLIAATKTDIFQSNFILINSKNANALTGKGGLEDVEMLMQTLKEQYPQIKNPTMSSTGVIGVRLPIAKIVASFELFDLYAKEGHKAAQAIMTTDSFCKEIAFEVECKSGTFKIGAMCKGAGMIHPSLATMLCFIATDAAIPAGEGNELLRKALNETFNAISVDGDMSTNDTVLLLSNKKSNVYDKEAFSFALKEVMHKLAIDIAKDGEGANKLVAFEVKNALNKDEAKKAARALSSSLLVKTAIFGEDPNWGRIASTIGASGIECSEESLSIYFNEICVYHKGNILFDEECEKKAAQIMKKKELCITCDLGIGTESFRAYGCDLGYNYVKINADYRS